MAEAWRFAEAKGRRPRMLADIWWVCGGVIPSQDDDHRRAAGVRAIFGPGTNIPEDARDILAMIGENRVAMAG